MQKHWAKARERAAKGSNRSNTGLVKRMWIRFVAKP